MIVRQCSSCGGFCKKSGCERRDNIEPASTEPAWHDAPTAPRLWVNSISGRVNVVIEETLHAWENTGARWFGPIPEDMK